MNALPTPAPQPPDLSGYRVGVTHSGEGAERLVRTFRRLNATVYHVPLIQFQELPQQGRLADLTGVQWLALTSPQGVKALSRALDLQYVPPGLKWAAVGESTARAMQQAGMPVHFMPARATGTALGQELPLVNTDLVLHVTSDQSKDDLPEALLARGARYERLVLYHTVPRQPSLHETAQLMASQVVTLASSSAAQQLARLGGQQVPVVVMGEQTAQTARHLGFQHVTVALEPSLNGLERAVLQLLSRPET